MSSYYSQSLQYKPHEQHYVQQTLNHTAISNNSHNNSTRNNTRNNDNNGIDVANNSNDDNVKYASPISKKMTTTTYYVQKSGVTGIVGSSPINTYGASTASDYNKINYATKSNDLQMSSTKINSHLLDHGYGATPQPSFSNSNSSDDPGCKNFTRTTDGGITSYYKVSIVNGYRCF